jgi:hypothetical protein
MGTTIDAMKLNLVWLIDHQQGLSFMTRLATWLAPLAFA